MKKYKTNPYFIIKYYIFYKSLYHTEKKKKVESFKKEKQKKHVMVITHDLKGQNYVFGELEFIGLCGFLPPKNSPLFRRRMASSSQSRCVSGSAASRLRNAASTFCSDSQPLLAVTNFSPFPFSSLLPIAHHSFSRFSFRISEKPCL